MEGEEPEVGTQNEGITKLPGKKILRKVGIFLSTLITETRDTTQMRILCENLKIIPKWKAVSADSHGCAGLL